MTSPVREAARAKEKELRDALPETVEISLERGAMLYLRPQIDGRWMADVRWPAANEKDPLLAAGGYRMGLAETAKAAEKIGRALFREGAKPEARMR